MAVFWDVAPCSLVEADVSEVLTASIIRAMSGKFEAGPSLGPRGCLGADVMMKL
jgi:hypothetical protein